MTTISFSLPDADAKRLAELAAREGLTPEEAVAAAVQARLDVEAREHREIEAGLAELDAGKGVSLAAYEREMDAFMASIRAKRA